MYQDEIVEQQLDDHGITVVTIPIDGHAGLLVSKGSVSVAYISPNVNRRKRAVILAEELGHHLTSVGDTVRIGDQRKIGRAEERAIRKAIELLVKPEDFIDAILAGIRNWPELSDYLDLPEDFLIKAVEVWMLTIGPCYCSRNSLLWFDPLELYH